MRMKDVCPYLKKDSRNTAMTPQVQVVLLDAARLPRPPKGSKKCDLLHPLQGAHSFSCAATAAWAWPCSLALVVSLRRMSSEMAQLAHMGGCQNHGPFLGTLHIRCRIIIGIQRGTVILTTTHIQHLITC